MDKPIRLWQEDGKIQPEYAEMWWCARPTGKIICGGNYSITEIHEYLQENGQWDLISHYFNSKEEILVLLPKNIKYKETRG